LYFLATVCTPTPKFHYLSSAIESSLILYFLNL
jgi:hypothetical protein